MLASALAAYAADPRIRKVKDLKGRTIGVSPQNGLLHVLMETLLFKHGGCRQATDTDLLRQHGIEALGRGRENPGLVCLGQGAEALFGFVHPLCHRPLVGR